ncbi:MAG TPA: DUF5602 domain-containing protein [Pyrinomonadaceae bacterium]|jgi:hypothetical protein
MNNFKDEERSSSLAAAAGRKMRGFYRNLSTGVALALLVAGSAFAQSVPAQQQSTNHTASSASLNTTGMIFGTATPLGKGSARSWVKLGKDGKPTAIGLTFTEAALVGLPQTLPAGQEGVEYVLALPPEAAATPFNHIGIDWNPQGHPPGHIYDTPHFDFHFYMISPQERNQITARGADREKARRQPPLEYVPDGYMYAPDSEIPRMGGHWADPQSNEFRGQPFTRSFLYGNYDGQIVFMEPMISKAFLDAKTSVTEIIKQPRRYATPGYYPTKYSILYDPATKQYTVALEGLTLR